MTVKLHNLVAKYMNKTIDIEDWEDIRKKYFEYSYLAFMTLCVHEIKSDCAANEIENIIGMNDIIEESILCYVLKIPGSYEFISEAEFMDMTMVKRDVNKSAVRAMAMMAMILRLRDAHKERQLSFLIHFRFFTFILDTSVNHG